MITFGFPLPARSRKKPTDGVAYPCQNRPCGCLTSEQCWQGDCCCFTLEEKLAWAEANGVEPPEHVRQLVESRGSRSVLPKKKSCCSEAEPAATPSTTAQPTCCGTRKPVATCCDDPSVCEATADTECPHCAAKANTSCCEKKALAREKESGVRWVVGIFAQKCRGHGPTGFFQLDPAVVPELKPIHLSEPERSDHVALRSDRIISVTHSPPTPPPRFG